MRKATDSLMTTVPNRNLGSNKSWGSDVTASNLLLPPRVASLPATPGPEGSVVYDRSTQATYFSTGAAWSPSSGNVTGPAASVDNHVARFDGTTGEVLQDGSPVAITDTGDVTGVRGLTAQAVANVAPDEISLNDAVWPLGTGTTGQVLTTDGNTPAALAWTTVVMGPSSSTDDHVARFDGTTGAVLQDGSPVAIADSGDVTGVRGLTARAIANVAPDEISLNDAVWPLGTGVVGQVLTTDGNTPAALSWTTVVTGPAGATDNHVARFDGTTGAVLQDGSPVAITDTGDVTGVRGLTARAVANVAPDEISLNDAVWPLGTGTAGQVLTTTGGTPAALSWITPQWEVTSEGAVPVDTLRPTGTAALTAWGAAPYDGTAANRMYFDATTGSFRVGQTNAASAVLGQQSVAMGQTPACEADFSSVVGGTGCSVETGCDYCVVGGETITVEDEAVNSIVFGRQHRITGRIGAGSSYNSIIGGTGCTIEPGASTSPLDSNTLCGSVDSIVENSSNSAVVGGDTNEILSSDLSAICGGSECRVDAAENSFIGGGNLNRCLAGRSCLLGGGGGRTRTIGQAAVGGGNYDAIGTFCLPIVAGATLYGNVAGNVDLVPHGGSEIVLFSHEAVTIEAIIVGRGSTTTQLWALSLYASAIVGTSAVTVYPAGPHSTVIWTANVGVYGNVTASVTLSGTGGVVITVAWDGTGTGGAFATRWCANVRMAHVRRP